MPVLTAKGLRRAYGDRVVLADVALGIDERERVGLVGANGAGKSTLARILAGAEAPDAGEVVPRSDARIAYLSQEPTFDGNPTAREAVVAAL
ncbi:MAG TPA: ATP-binding cassette domain-containing protein, partial [Polyangiaceae bacterium LLY-WYZ-14_1]|nr:ATP-binding cassette domain-containing protein [Polyangiaceae bacterium LLY-WYZ-14_1]